MSESNDNTQNERDESGSESHAYTITVNNKTYELNEQFRASIEDRAEIAYSDNDVFSCWWRVADEDDDADPDTIHAKGDPILVIETIGTTVPWENLDQLELEMQDVSSYDGYEQSDDSDQSNGLSLIRPDDVSDDTDDNEEKSRTHFGLTPRGFEEVPSPDGERPDRVPAKPEEFDEPSMVVWVPEDPNITHTWDVGEAITQMDTWVEWNIQQRANQPRAIDGTSNLHAHYESLLKMHGCEKLAEMKPKQKTPKRSGSVERKGEKQFKEGKYGGNNWHV